MVFMKLNQYLHLRCVRYVMWSLHVRFYISVFKRVVCNTHMYVVLIVRDAKEWLSCLVCVLVHVLAGVCVCMCVWVMVPVWNDWLSGDRWVVSGCQRELYHTSTSLSDAENREERQTDWRSAALSLCLLFALLAIFSLQPCTLNNLPKLSSQCRSEHRH